VSTPAHSEKSATVFSRVNHEEMSAPELRAAIDRFLMVMGYSHDTSLEEVADDHADCQIALTLSA